MRFNGYTESRIEPIVKNSKNLFRFNMSQKRTLSTSITPLNVELNP